MTDAHACTAEDLAAARAVFDIKTPRISRVVEHHTSRWGYAASDADDIRQAAQLLLWKYILRAVREGRKQDAEDLNCKLIVMAILAERRWDRGRPPRRSRRTTCPFSALAEDLGDIIEGRGAPMIRVEGVTLTLAEVLIDQPDLTFIFEDRWIAMADAAQMLGLTAQGVVDLQRRHVLGVSLGGTWYLDRDKVIALARQREVTRAERATAG